jgi:hypothetical protein
LDEADGVANPLSPSINLTARTPVALLPSATADSGDDVMDARVRQLTHTSKHNFENDFDFFNNFSVWGKRSIPAMNTNFVYHFFIYNYYLISQLSRSRIHKSGALCLDEYAVSSLEITGAFCASHAHKFASDSLLNSYFFPPLYRCADSQKSAASSTTAVAATVDKDDGNLMYGFGSSAADDDSDDGDHGSFYIVSIAATVWPS